MEDGREIFDDDEIDDSYVATDKVESGRGQKRKAKLAAQPGKGNIRNLLGAMPAKKKEVCFISVNKVTKWNVCRRKWRKVGSAVDFYILWGFRILY